MNTIEFLKAVLPEDCWYFVATPSPTGKGFKHYACDSIAGVAQRALYQDSEGKQNVFFGVSGYRADFVDVAQPDGTTKRKFRTKQNVKLVKAFWLDLDVGVADEGAPAKYASQVDAIQALGKFLATTKLPRPMIVNSGYGVHCYWLLTQAIMPGQWAHTAKILKEATHAFGLLADDSRTSDEASILRPVGTHNRKVKDGVAGCAEVTCGAATEPVDYAAFHAALDKAVEASGVERDKEPRRATGVNPMGLSIQPGAYPKSDADKVADQCGQIHSFKLQGGSSEPHWYHSIQVIAHTVDGEKKVHEWSAKHKDYSEAETETKISQVRALGPTTCAKFQDINAVGCRGCRFKGKITSPIQLGVTITQAEAPKVEVNNNGVMVVADLPMPPHPFARGTGDSPGLFVMVDAGTPVQFYPHDLYPTGLTYDVDAGEEVCNIKHWMPQQGWQEFSVRSSLIAYPTDFIAKLMASHVSVAESGKKPMVAYMQGYIRELQDKTKIKKLYSSMGWKEDGFLLGLKLYTKEGIIPAGVTSKVSHELTSAIKTVGTMEEWQKGIKILDQPGLEAHMFSFLVGFGAPLFAITGYDGSMLSMLGDTNSGKTLSANAMLSIYGNFRGLRIGKKDTLNAKIEKMAALGNLPCYIDELTNIDAEELSQFIYQVSEGRGRARLRSDSTMREAAHWQTLGVTSTNASLMGKLATGKDNAEAEMVRLLEYRVERIDWFESQMTEVYNYITKNYGHAGEIYINAIVSMDQEALRTEVNKVAASIRARVDFNGKERYWINTIAVILYGAAIAHAAGILPFDNFAVTYTRLFNWVAELIRSSREEVSSNHMDDTTVLAQFLDKNMPGRLVVNRMNLGQEHVIQVVKPPVGPLVVRYEQHTGIIYIDRKVLRTYLEESQVDYTPMKKRLSEKGILMNHFGRKVLGCGTSFSGGQTNVWIINAKHPDLEDALPIEGVEA